MICPATTSTVAPRSAERAARTAWAKAQAPLSEVPARNWQRARRDSCSSAWSVWGTSPTFIRSLGSSPGMQVTNRSVTRSQVAR
jgi:hypothetical protein